MNGKWRVGRKVPMNVYDENDIPVCMAQTAEYAKRIVAAMNYYMRAAEFAASGPKIAMPPLDCKGVDPASRTGKISTRKP